MQWEYDEIRVPPNKIRSTLNAVGREGWELVQMWKEGPSFIAIVKRIVGASGPT